MIIGASKNNDNIHQVKQLHLHVWNVPEIKLFTEDGNISNLELAHKTKYPDRMYKVNEELTNEI